MTASEVGFWLVAYGGALFRWVAVGRIREVLGERWRLAPAPTGGADPPVSISVCVPARDEAAVIDRLLSSLDAQDHAKLEVIVVDDRSTDGTGDPGPVGGVDPAGRQMRHNQPRQQDQDHLADQRFGPETPHEGSTEAVNM